MRRRKKPTMCKHRTRFMAAAIVVSALAIGCDKNDKNGGAANQSGGATSGAYGTGQTGTGGTGNAGTTSGSGATSGVGGGASDTQPSVHGIGDTPSGRGITTEPATKPSNESPG